MSIEYHQIPSKKRSTTNNEEFFFDDQDEEEDLFNSDYATMSRKKFTNDIPEEKNSNLKSSSHSLKARLSNNKYENIDSTNYLYQNHRKSRNNSFNEAVDPNDKLNHSLSKTSLLKSSFKDLLGGGKQKISPPTNNIILARNNSVPDENKALIMKRFQIKPRTKSHSFTNHNDINDDDYGDDDEDDDDNLKEESDDDDDENSEKIKQSNNSKMNFLSRSFDEKKANLSSSIKSRTKVGIEINNSTSSTKTYSSETSSASSTSETPSNNKIIEKFCIDENNNNNNKKSLFNMNEIIPTLIKKTDSIRMRHHSNANKTNGLSSFDQANDVLFSSISESNNIDNNSRNPVVYEPGKIKVSKKNKNSKKRENFVAISVLFVLNLLNYVDRYSCAGKLEIKLQFF